MSNQRYFCTAPIVASIATFCFTMFSVCGTATRLHGQEKAQEKLQEKAQERKEKEQQENKTPTENIYSQNSSFSQELRSEGVIGRKAMVVSAHPEASRIGTDILKRGGNAVDAAIAVQFALAVCYPIAGNLGGGGFMVVRLNNGKLATLDFREMAPKLASRDMYLDSAGNFLSQISVQGHKASGVPGTVAGMEQAHKRYGKLSWKALVQTAIDLAHRGVALTKREARGFNNVAPTLKLVNPDKRYFLPPMSSRAAQTEAQTESKPDSARLWSEGDTLVQEDLAQVLERIRDRGRDGFYKGKTAALVVEEMKRGGGLISAQDLEDYRAVWRTPLVTTYKNYRLIGMPPPSSGGIGVAQMLQMLEPFPIKDYGHNTEKTAHVMIEAERRYYAERAEYLGDPDFYRVPTKGLLNRAYTAERMKSFNPDKATPSSQVTHGDRAVVMRYESMETTHFSIVDASGNAVAVTTTLNGNYGSKVVVGGAGFLMNNEMDDFSAKPGAPNMFGAVGDEANSIAPKKRMLSSMTPTIVEQLPAPQENSKASQRAVQKAARESQRNAKGKLFMVLGSPGGTTILTSVLQAFLNVTEHGMNMQQAVNAGRFHHQHLPDHVLNEPHALTDEVRKALEAKGHLLSGISAIGKVDAVLVRRDGTLEGAADPRADDTAVGY